VLRLPEYLDMGGSIFLTGATGFLGSRVLMRISRNPQRTVICLIRGTPPTGHPPNVRFVRGDLLDPTAYTQALAECDTVLHLAGATGKKTPAEYMRVNRDGTKALLEAASRASVQRFLFVSTIAVKFPDKAHYYYAQSKQLAEEAITQGKLQWTVVRPTMIFGDGSPVLQGLARLATLPVVPVFGDGGALVQPIFVDDLAHCLTEMCDTTDLDGQTIEIGGPEVMGIKDLLLRIRRGAPILHLPMRPISAALVFLETFLRPLLPITAGQLCSFTNNGTISASQWVTDRQTSMKGINEMLGLSQLGLNTGQIDQVERECRTYSRCLIEQNPSAYVVEKYRNFHELFGTRPIRPVPDSFVRTLAILGSSCGYLCQPVT
jgi:nucleoside-diphosphate-sugar epimerase